MSDGTGLGELDEGGGFTVGTSEAEGAGAALGEGLPVEEVVVFVSVECFSLELEEVEEPSDGVGLPTLLLAEGT